MPRDLRDPEMLGMGLQYWRHQHGYEDKPLHEIADLIDRSMEVRDYPHDETTVRETMAAYRHEIVEAAQHDKDVWDLAREKGWVAGEFASRPSTLNGRCPQHTHDGLQRCMRDAAHTGEHFFPDGTRHV